MSPAVAVILGRPNVGKSSLFNRLTGTRRALVAAEAGLTRDLRRGEADHRADLTLVDTGGLVAEGDSLQQEMAQRIWQLCAEADLVLLMSDASVGPTGLEEELVSGLRRLGAPMLLVANKVDLGYTGSLAADYAPLGLGEPVEVSARTNRGMGVLRRRLDALLPPVGTSSEVSSADRQKVLLLGRPNAGKSTLLNRLCGEDRALVSEIPGTTRDEVEAQFTLADTELALVDTAGVARRWRHTSKGQALAASRSLVSLKAGSPVVLLVDVNEGLTEQDARLLGSALNMGCATVLAFSKADSQSEAEVRQVMQRARRRLEFADFVPVCSISSHSGKGIARLLQLLRQAMADARRELPTAELNRILRRLLERHPPPLVQGRRTSLRYAHAVRGEGRRGPQRLVRIHGSGISRLPDSYRRYLESGFRRALGLSAAPVRVEFAAAANPYVPTQGPGRRRKT